MHLACWPADVRHGSPWAIAALLAVAMVRLCVEPAAAQGLSPACILSGTAITTSSIAFAGVTISEISESTTYFITMKSFMLEVADAGIGNFHSGMDIVLSNWTARSEIATQYNQHFSLLPWSDGTWRMLISKDSSLCFDVEGESTDVGAGIQMWACKGANNENQRFSLHCRNCDASGPSLCKIRNLKSGLCLYTMGSVRRGLGDGARVVQVPCDQAGDPIGDITFWTVPRS